MAWFVTLASKMTGKEIPGVGMAPGGKIKKPKEEVEVHLQHFLAIAEAMAKNKNWSFLAQYSILKEVFADLRSIATTSSTEPMEEMEEEKSKGAEEEHGQSGASANVLLDKGMEKKEEVKEDGEKPAWIRYLEKFVAGLWLWQEEEEGNAGSTVETEGWSNISQVRQLSSIELLLIFLAYILCEYGI